MWCLLTWCSYFADTGDNLHLATDGSDHIEEYWLENDAVSPARKVRNLGELIQKPGEQKGIKREGGGEEMDENGVWCVIKLNKMSNRKNYFGSLAGSGSPRRLAESELVFRGRQAADSHERCCSAGFKRSTRSGGGKAASGTQRLIKGSSGLMWDNLCKQCYVGGEQSSNILCD